MKIIVKQDMINITNRLTKAVSRYLNAKLVMLMDVCLSLFASVITVGIVILLIKIKGPVVSFIILWLTLSLIFTLAASLVFRTHKIIIRHSSMKDVTRYVAAAFVKVLLMMTVLLICDACGTSFMSVPKLLALLAIDFLLTSFFIVAVRISMIVAYSVITERVKDRRNCKRVLIYSTSEKSVALVTRLQKSPHYKVVGFVSADAYKRSFTVSDYPVYCLTNSESIRELQQKIAFDAILFSSDEDIKKEKEHLIAFATQESVQILVAPSIDQLQQGVGSNGIREVKIEDLLGREEIKIAMGEVIDNFKGKTVMVTGAAGSIGSELCRQLAGFGVGCLILYDNAETPMHQLRLELSEKFPELKYVPVIGDVRLRTRLDFAFRTYNPQVVFHAAAYKHVPLMEENPCEAVIVNVAGTRNVADKCLEYNVEKMVMISTDKAVNPTNIMGCTKRLAEIYVQSLGLAIESGMIAGSTKFVTTRFGNVLGSNGSVIPRFRAQLAKGGPLTVTHPDITRFFMTIPEACLLVMEAATMPTENRICVFDMGESVKIDTLARNMIRLSGLRPDVDIKIEYTGLRPGEKLYEEVLSNVENTDPTSHDRIRIAHVRTYDYTDAKENVDRLEFLSREVDIPTMVKLMKAIVPEFISNNSKYSEYDAK